MTTSSFACLSLSNQFSFTCPIFNQDVEMRGCVVLRDRVYAGKHLSSRRGCQACISSSKCPAAEMVRRIAFNTSDATDHCASNEPKVGKLPGDVLERVRLVLVQESHLQMFSVPVAEREAILSSRDRIEAQMASAPGGRVEPRGYRASSAEEPRRASQKAARGVPAPATTTPTALGKAAATGDLAASLNAA